MPHRAFWLGFAALTTPLQAQQWNDPPTRLLVERAVRARTAATNDSTLHAYSARARGVLTFQAEFDERIALGSRLVKADELDVEVYWERPDRSKQVIRAWRDSTFFPTDLRYHRDHLGIVSNDFGPTIRIGDGDEVRDVVHPLSPDGPTWYDYRARDTVTIATGATRVVLVAIDVRPKRPDLPAVAGTLFLDRDRAAVVRFAFSFTGAAYRDRNLEDITVKLERALIDGRWWLPYRQSIEIRRRSSTIDWPVRGVIRGRWEIADHRVNPDTAAGPGAGILGLREPGGPPWSGPLLAAVDTVSGPADRLTLEQIRTTARRLVRQRVLDGLPRFRPGVSRASDLLRFTRVEGARIGAGVVWRGAGFDRIEGWGAVATGDGRLTGRLRFTRRLGGVQLIVAGTHAVEDADPDEPAASSPVNSLAAAIGGRDLGDYLMMDRVGISVRGGGTGGLVAEGGLSREWTGGLATISGPLFGPTRANPDLAGPAAWVGRAGLAWDRSGVRTLRGRLSGEVGAGKVGWGRLVGRLDAGWPAASGEWRIEGGLGVATAGTPPRRLLTVGGPGSLLGEGFRAFGGRAMALAHAERVWSVPGPSIGLGVFGRTEGRMLVGPFVAAGGAWGGAAGPWLPSDGIRPVAGIAVELFDRSLRIEVGQAWRGGRGPSLNVDVAKRWWPIL